jgi:glyoxylase-like metal-dependent hydrolase (beta-lactamase superfamily II)
MIDILFEQLAVGEYKNFSYIAGDYDSGSAVVFDPAWNVNMICSTLLRNNLSCKFIVNTHAHFDHIEGNGLLRERTGCKVIMHESSKLQKDIGVKENEELHVGKLCLKFLHTPGHSPESMCIIVNDFALVSGDTLFIGECGRVDLPGGDPEQLFYSFEKLRRLDRKLTVYPGHDYGKAKYSSLGEQIETNYTLAERSKDEFIKFMSQP